MRHLTLYYLAENMKIIPMIKDKSRNGLDDSDVEYVLNPSLKMSATYEVRELEGIVRRVDLLKLDSPGQLIDVLRKLSDSGDLITHHIGRMSDSTRTALLDAGLVVRRNRQPQEVNFNSNLSVEHLEWVPQKYLEAKPAARSELRLNPTLQFQLDSVLRPENGSCRFPPAKDFPFQVPIAWIYDYASAMSWPYFLDENSLEILTRLKKGELLIEDLDENVFLVFWFAGILVPKDFEEIGTARLEKVRTESRANLEKQRFIVLKELLPPLQLAALRKYFRERELNGYLQIDMDQVIKGRYFAHNDPVASFIHRQTGRLLCELTGEPVFPSYCFLSAYKPGAVLEKHTDRPQCRWNGSLLLDMNPEVSRDQSWPIYLEVEGKEIEVQMEMGECLIYQGSELFHWRNELPLNQRQSLLLLHYVPIDFTGRLT